MPRALLVDSDNIIREDKYIKNIYTFNLENDLINHYENKGTQNEEEKK